MDQTQKVSSGSLKISLKLPTARRPCPFYLMKESLPPSNRLLGSKDLISDANLGSAYQQYCNPGKLKTDLASFLPQLCNTSNLCSAISSSTNLRTLIEKPPITGKMIGPPNDLKGFILAPGTVPEAYRLFDTSDISRLLGNIPAPIEDDSKNYDEYGNNYGDSQNETRAHRMKLKRTLDNGENEGAEKKKKHKKDKKKSKKEKKRDKERKNIDVDDTSRTSFSGFH